MMNLRKFTGLLSLLLIVSACGDAVEISIEMDDDANSTQSAAQQQDGWTMLFDGKTLHGWNVQNTDTWLVEDGVLTVKAKGDIWTQQQYGNFVFECDFKISPECNSGIFIRTGDTENEVQTGMEIQILDGTYDPKSMRNACGAVYDCLAPTEVVVKAPGEWNTTRITCRNNMINVVMNDVPIISMDVDKWVTPSQNPDGTPNKFKNAIKDFPRSGYIGFQYHGHPVWFRNIRIKEL